VGVVTEGIADGSVRAVDPTLVAFTIVSQAIWFAVVGYQIPATVGLDASADDFATDVEAHVVEVVTRFLVSEG